MRALLSEALFIHIGKTKSKNPFGPQVYGLLLPLLLFIVVLSLPLGKIMKKELFCVMNPFDDMCDQKSIDCLTFAFRDNIHFIGETVNPKVGYMKIQTEGTLPGLNPLATSLACIFFFDVNTYFNIDNINVEGKAYNFVKLIEGIDFKFFQSSDDVN